MEERKKELAVFAAKKTAVKDGKPNTFYVYSTKLTNGEGEEVYVEVKFRESCGSPKPEQCPMNIVVSNRDCNLTVKNVKYIDEATAEEHEIIRRRLWISKWEVGSEYVDTSLDGYDW